MTRPIAIFVLCASLAYVPAAFAQAGGGEEMPSNAKSNSSSDASKAGGSMKSGGSSSSSDATTGNAEKSGTTYAGDQKDKK